jgi:Outer membrane protein beta-barrel domain
MLEDQMRIRELFFIVLITVILVPVNPSSVSAQESHWSFSFQYGSSNPTGDFSTYVENDMMYGLSIEYSQHPLFGFRFSYGHRQYDITEPGKGFSDVDLDTAALYGLLNHRFPKWIRVYGLLGPTFYFADGQRQIGLGADSKDIALSGGIGFVFNPVPNWGVQVQSLYFNSEIGNKSYRTEWFETTIGLTFSF